MSFRTVGLGILASLSIVSGLFAPSSVTAGVYNDVTGSWVAKARWESLSTPMLIQNPTLTGP